MSEEAENNLTNPVVRIPYVGQAQANILSRLGIKSVENLLCYAPRDLLDLRKVVSIAEAKRSEDKQVIYGEVRKTSVFKTPRKRMWVVDARLGDSSGEIDAIWFNQPYLRNSLKFGQKYIFYGSVEYNFSTKTRAISNPLIFPEPGFIPLYSLTSGITSRQINRFAKLAISNGYNLKEFLPENVVKKNNLMPLNQVAKALHSPLSLENFHSGCHRLNFNHLLEFILANLILKKRAKQTRSLPIINDRQLSVNFTEGLPFKLTEDQKNAVGEILEDLAKSHPMNRLLQGDVGSGKTIVALIASLAVINAGYKVVWLAPTEILAAQHFSTTKKFFRKFDIKAELLTAQTKLAAKVKTQKSKLKSEIKNEKWNILIATHAAFYQDLPKDIALVVVDEQHRFGVEQREMLASEKGKVKRVKSRPHFLSLSATPIPRSLAHIVFGNLDISTIKQMPKGRKLVKTFLIPEDKRAGAYEFIDKLISKGQQAFVICPLIYARDCPSSQQGTVPNTEIPLFEDEKSERKTVTTEIENLKKTILGKRRIAALHGKIKSADKERIMTKMSRGEIDILVSTSVVEVGVDIKNASVIVVEDADRFGLSQLHQFRGRVGRSDIQSYCFLFTKQSDNEKTRARLKAFVQSNDGFKLAELDLKQRGPGAILGLEQSGFKGLNPLWFENTELLRDASAAAREMIDNLAKFPILKRKVLKQLQTEHLE